MPLSLLFLLIHSYRITAELVTPTWKGLGFGFVDDFVLTG
jgi:hypothetical protein